MIARTLFARTSRRAFAACGSPVSVTFLRLKSKTIGVCIGIPGLLSAAVAQSVTILAGKQRFERTCERLEILDVVVGLKRSADEPVARSLEDRDLDAELVVE